MRGDEVGVMKWRGREKSRIPNIHSGRDLPGTKTHEMKRNTAVNLLRSHAKMNSHTYDIQRWRGRVIGACTVGFVYILGCCAL
jgi:hypothetical protein